MTFRDVVDNKSKWINGILETHEGGYEGYNEKITDIYIEGELFYVKTISDGEVFVNMFYSSIKEIKPNVLSFSIPCVGMAYIYGSVAER